MHKKILFIFLSLVIFFDCLAAARNQDVISRTSTTNVINRTKSNLTSRSTNQQTIKRQQKNSPTRKSSVKTRSALKSSVIHNKANQRIIARAVTGTNYSVNNSDTDTCKEIYFTCMDQFCATVNPEYRRCICSSKINSIQQQQNSISRTNSELQDFQNYNIDVISKTKNEVLAMSTATEGEQAIKKDTSASGAILQNITDVLQNQKNNKSSNNTNLEISWAKENFVNSADISSLTGEYLYNAVHEQCATLVSQTCQNNTTLQMIYSMYGMFIDNDCTTLEKNINSQKTVANTNIRTITKEMQNTRLDTYNSHNSLSTSDCMAKVRENLTTDTACGKDFVHCLDITGIYLNITTGEPIYSPQFYQLKNQISLSGNILDINKNYVDVLNSKRSFAEQSLDSCREDSEYVWNQFITTAIKEIYQQQQQKVQQVKQECLQVVNECHAEKTEQITSFGEKTSLALQVKTSDDLCEEKLTACSNLYGESDTGLNVLVATMNTISEKNVEQSCKDLLQTFLTKLCTPNTNVHKYPFDCIYYSIGKYDDNNNNSVYTKLVNFAEENCSLDSNTKEVSQSVLADINQIIVKLKQDMSTTLAEECINMNGAWEDIMDDTNAIHSNATFSAKINSNKDWGHCNYTKEYYLDSDGVSKICPKGYYCQNNTKKPCEGITYTDLEGMAVCKTCPPEPVQYKAYWTNDHTKHTDSSVKSIDEWSVSEWVNGVRYYTANNAPLHDRESGCIVTYFGFDIPNAGVLTGGDGIDSAVTMRDGTATPDATTGRQVTVTCSAKDGDYQNGCSISNFICKNEYIVYGETYDNTGLTRYPVSGNLFAPNPGKHSAVWIPSQYNGKLGDALKAACLSVKNKSNEYKKKIRGYEYTDGGITYQVGAKGTITK